MAVDYGRSHDHTALVVARPDKVSGKLLVVNALALKGTRATPITLAEVEHAILEWVRRYRVERVHIDPFQMIGSAERLAERLRWPLLNSVDADERPWVKGLILQPIAPAYLNRLTMGVVATHANADAGIDPCAVVGWNGATASPTKLPARAAAWRCRCARPSV
jgi:hypothetical protein